LRVAPVDRLAPPDEDEDEDDPRDTDDERGMDDPRDDPTLGRDRTVPDELLPREMERGMEPDGERTPGVMRVGAVRGTMTGRDDGVEGRSTELPPERVGGITVDDDGRRTSGLRLEPTVPRVAGPLPIRGVTAGSRTVRLRNGLLVGRSAVGRRPPPPRRAAMSRSGAGGALRSALSSAIRSAVRAGSFAGDAEAAAVGLAVRAPLARAAGFPGLASSRAVSGDRSPRRARIGVTSVAEVCRTPSK
jgi:hypothetical protein